MTATGTEPFAVTPARCPTPLLEAHGVSKSFGAVEALVDVDFDVAAGEVVALVGDNGAGKSTLIKAIAGVQPADGGRYRFDGRDVSIRNPRDATRLGIATVYQDLALCDNLDVVGNVYLGQELVARSAATGRRARRDGHGAPDARPVRVAGRHDAGDVRGVTGALSGGQRQAVAIARSLVGDPRMLILDEPTAALGVAQTAQVLQLIHTLRDRGLAVVVISHNLDTVFDVADRIVVLRLGRLEATFDRRRATREDVVAAILGATAPRPETAVA